MEPLAIYKIDPGEYGRPIVRDVKRNEPVFPDRVFPSPQVALAAVEDLARERGWKLNVIYTPDKRVDRIEVYPAPVRLELWVTPEFDELLSTLAAEMKGSKGQAILKGLALLQIALEAKREGKRLVVIDDRDNSEQEVDEV